MEAFFSRNFRSTGKDTHIVLPTNTQWRTLTAEAISKSAKPKWRFGFEIKILDGKLEIWKDEIRLNQRQILKIPRLRSGCKIYLKIPFWHQDLQIKLWSSNENFYPTLEEELIMTLYNQELPATATEIGLAVAAALKEQTDYSYDSARDLRVAIPASTWTQVLETRSDRAEYTVQNTGVNPCRIIRQAPPQSLTDPADDIGLELRGNGLGADTDSGSTVFKGEVWAWSDGGTEIKVSEGFKSVSLTSPLQTTANGTFNLPYDLTNYAAQIQAATKPSWVVTVGGATNAVGYSELVTLNDSYFVINQSKTALTGTLKVALSGLPLGSYQVSLHPDSDVVTLGNIVSFPFTVT